MVRRVTNIRQIPKANTVTEENNERKTSECQPYLPLSLPSTKSQRMRKLFRISEEDFSQCLTALAQHMSQGSMWKIQLNKTNGGMWETN